MSLFSLATCAATLRFENQPTPQLCPTMPKEQLQEGFVWIEDLLAELERYDKQRDIYPTLESYMPNLAEAYNT